MSKNFYKVKNFYIAKLWFEKMVWNTVGHWTIAEEFQEITGKI